MSKLALSIAISLIGIVAWGGAPASAAGADDAVSTPVVSVQVHRIKDSAPPPYMRRANWQFAAAGYGDYWVSTHQGSSLSGGYGTHVTYSWQIQAGSNGRVCVQGQWNRDTTGRTWDTGWAPLGCGESGGGRLHWGPFLGNPKVRAKVQDGFLGNAYAWKF